MAHQLQTIEEAAQRLRRVYYREKLHYVKVDRFGRTREAAVGEFVVRDLKKPLPAGRQREQGGERL
jgi:hypothetical protein